MTGPANWRDLIEVHPAAGLFPMMSEEELKALASDIQENGQRVGVILWTPERAEHVRPRKGPEKLYLLDGRNRLEAIERAYSDPEDRASAISAALSCDPRQGGAATLLYGDDDPFEAVVSANVHRRHLTAARKREIIAELLRRKPERSDRATAKLAGAAHPLVAEVRSELEQSGDVEFSSTRTDTAGRQQPARKRAAAGRQTTAASAPPSQARDKAVAQFSQLLHAQLAKTLDDLTRILRGEGDRIRAIPMDKRIAIARAYLEALGVGRDDLGDGGRR